MSLLPRSSRRPRASRRPRTAPILLVLAALTVMSVDAGTGADSPANRLRTVVGDVFGPVQSELSAATRPLTAVRDYVSGVSRLRTRNAALAARNAALQSSLETAGLRRHQRGELATMRTLSRNARLSLVPAAVVAVGPAQAFSRTVTIDVGSSDGVRPDMTVLNADGLVGRVVRAGRSNATVLLVVDANSVVGGRVGSSLELGFLTGDGNLSGDGRLTLTTLDRTARPRPGDTVVTWGSRNGRPYVAGVPVGRVETVQTSPREQSTVSTVRPFVDFTALDLVSVVVGRGSGRTAARAAGAGSR